MSTKPNLDEYHDPILYDLENPDQIHLREQQRFYAHAHHADRKPPARA
jgi:hypothetical protein